MSEVRKRKEDGKENKEKATKTPNEPAPTGREPIHTPSNVRFRMIMILLALLVATVLAFYPAFRDYLRKPTDPDWWKRTIVYQVYPRSFQDSDGDGVGDLQGVASRLDHFSYIRVGAIWLSPFYTSPMVDFGYDVANFTEVDPLFGTMADFDDLVAKAHKKGIKVIVDFIPNHTSNKHRWFMESRKPGKDNPYRDYYVWHPGKRDKQGKRMPPNNWVSVFGGSMWTFDRTRGEYYLHQFTKEQPDLNFRNPIVQEEILDVFAFWLGRGVDGFRVDAIRHMFESENLLQDEPVRPQPNKAQPDQYEYYRHPHTVNLQDVHDVIRSWRALFDKHYAKTGNYVFMVAEVFPDDGNQDVMEYYHSGADMPFNFNLLQIGRACGGWCVRDLVRDWMDKMPTGKWPNWVIGNHDQPRVTQKLGRKMVNSMNLLLLLLPGTPTTYQGEELGMLPIAVSYEETQDPFGINMGPDRYKEFSRDPCRSPMQWSKAKNAGFSSGDKPWLPVHPEYKVINAKSQRLDHRKKSPLQFYREISQIRKDKTLMVGAFDFGVVTDSVFSFIRFREGHPGYLVAINFGNRTTETNFRRYEGIFEPRDQFIPETGYVVINTGTAGKDSFVPDENFVHLNKIRLQPGEGVVMRFWPGF